MIKLFLQLALMMFLAVPAIASTQNSSANVSFGTVTNGNFCTYATTNNQISCQTSGALTQWSGTSPGDIYYNQGNVAIGTAVAGSLLYVQSNQDAQTFIKLLNANNSTTAHAQFLVGQDAANNYFTVLTNPSGSVNNSLSVMPSSAALLTGPSYTGGMVIDTSANGPIIFATGGLTQGTTTAGGNERMRILGTGNVGINTITPGQTLDIQGTVRATNFIGSLTGTASGNAVAGSPGASTYRSVTVNSTGGVTAGTNPTTFTTYAISDISANLASALTDEVGSGFAVFNASPNFTGNVGIGSLNAGQTLDVNGSVRMTGFTLTGQGASSGNVMVSNAVGIGTWMAASTLPISGGGSGTVNGGTTGQVGYYASSTTAISGSSAITITGASSGNNVGLGSATPGAILDVQGTARMLGVNIGTSGTGNYMDVEGTNGPIVFFGVSSGSTAKNVGIGTFTPGQMFDVAGAGRFLGTGNTQLNPTAGNVGIGTSLSLNKLDVAGGVSIGTTYAGYQTVPSNGLIVQGNVGIGSITPGQALDVNGTVRGLSSGACSFLYKCVGGVDAGVIQTVTCGLCPGGSCTQMNGCF